MPGSTKPPARVIRTRKGRIYASDSQARSRIERFYSQRFKDVSLEVFDALAITYPFASSHLSNRSPRKQLRSAGHLFVRFALKRKSILRLELHPELRFDTGCMLQLSSCCRRDGFFSQKDLIDSLDRTTKNFR